MLSARVVTFIIVLRNIYQSFGPVTLLKYMLLTNNILHKINVQLTA